MNHTKPSSQFTAKERLESVKAGTLAAMSVTLAYGLLTVGNNLLLAERFDALASLQTDGINLPFGLASALISGFLFGITTTLCHSGRYQLSSQRWGSAGFWAGARSGTDGSGAKSLVVRYFWLGLYDYVCD